MHVLPHIYTVVKKHVHMWREKMYNSKGDSIDNIDDFGDTISHCLETTHTYS